jgi:hypothetical protein
MLVVMYHDGAFPLRGLLPRSLLDRDASVLNRRVIIPIVGYDYELQMSTWI